MKIVGLDGREYSWNFSKNADRRRTRKKSGPHKRTQSVLRSLFPRSIILEEVSLPGTSTISRKSTLYADFFLPDKPLIVEVHGEQHYVYNDFYYKNKAEFYKAKSRDRDKIEWCEFNNISIAVIDSREDKNEWKNRILDAIRASS